MKTSFEVKGNINPSQNRKMMMDLYINGGNNHNFPSTNKKVYKLHSSRPISANPRDGSMPLLKFNQLKPQINQFDGSNLNKTNSASLLNNTRLKSAHNKVEQEKLYENCIHLKNSINNLNKELNFFRSEVHKKDSELKKQNKALQDILTATDGQTNINLMASTVDFKTFSKIKENNLVNNLKLQYKDLKKAYAAKEHELEEIKKLTKVTKVKEVQLENQVLLEEMDKLKSGYELALARNCAYEKMQKEYYILHDNFTRQEMFISQLQDQIKNMQNGAVGDNMNLGENEDNKNGNHFDPTRSSNFKKTFKDSQINFFSDRNLNKDLESKNKKIKELENEITKLKSGNINPLLHKYEHENKKLKDKIQTLEIKLALGDLNSAKESQKPINKTCTFMNKNYKVGGNSNVNTNLSIDGSSNINKNKYQSENTQNLLLNEEQVKDFVYVIKKHCQVMGITVDALTETTPSQTTPGIDKNIDEEIANRLIILLKLKNLNNKSKMLQFIKSISNKTTIISLFKEDSLFKKYSEEEEKDLTKLLVKDVKPHSFEELLSTLQNLDQFKTGLVDIKTLRDILKDNLQIKEEIVEFIIYTLLKASLNKEEYGLEEIYYQNIIQLFTSEKSQHVEMLEGDSSNLISNSHYSENNEENNKPKVGENGKSEANADDSEEVVLTVKEFNQKVDQILSKLADILVANKKTVREFFQHVITTHAISETESYDAIALLEFVTNLRNSGISIDTIDIYCLYTKLKYSDEYEMVDVNKLVDEMINYGIFEEHLTAVNTTNPDNLTKTNRGGDDGEIKTQEGDPDQEDKPKNPEDHSLDLENIQDMDIEGLADEEI